MGASHMPQQACPGAQSHTSKVEQAAQERIHVSLLCTVTSTLWRCQWHILNAKQLLHRELGLLVVMVCTLHQL